MVGEPDPGLQMLRRGEDIRTESNILFPMELTILGVISFGRV